MTIDAIARPSATPDPRRYFEAIDRSRSAEAEHPPVCLYLEVTNRCNLLCETCQTKLSALALGLPSWSA